MCYIYIYIYIHKHLHRNIYIYIYIHIHIYRHLYAHTYKHTHTYTNIYTNIYPCVKLFVICFDTPQAQMPHHVATSQLNRDKSKITGFHKMRDTRAGNPRTDSSNKSQ